MFEMVRLVVSFCSNDARVLGLRLCFLKTLRLPFYLLQRIQQNRLLLLAEVLEEGRQGIVWGRICRCSCALSVWANEHLVLCVHFVQSTTFPTPHSQRLEMSQERMRRARRCGSIRQELLYREDEGVGAIVSNGVRTERDLVGSSIKYSVEGLSLIHI